jgi:transcriptional regulator with GAF, ATPase, and Fis domain
VLPVTSEANLLGLFADLVVGADKPHRMGERTLEVVMALVNGRSGGIFAAADERLTLFASRGIDQHVLDAVETLWRQAKGQLRNGEPIYVPDCTADRDLAGVAAGGPASLAMFPIFDGDHLVALLYLDSAEPHFCQPSDVERLSKFSRMLASAVRPQAEDARRETTGWEAYLERTPVSDIERQKLLLLLNRNDWNIARVARLMGVTRRTIYLRLQRYNIPRERVYKTRLRPTAS